MILQNLIKTISERMSEVRGGVPHTGVPHTGVPHTGVPHTGVPRTRLFVGVALCAVTLFALVGCPDNNTPPVITLTGSEFIVLEINGAFTDEGATVSHTDPNYTGMVTATITGTGSTIDTTAMGVYTITYTAPADAAGLTPIPLTRTVRIGADADGNGRTDINFLEDLAAVNDARTGFYELTRDLDFADGDSYTDGTVNANWCPTGGNPDSATNEGWVPIGTGGGNGSFSGMFFGNGFVISNLYVRRGVAVGLFGFNSGVIAASYATGNVDGGAGMSDFVGGLVGVGSLDITNYGFGTVMTDNDETATTSRSIDASPPETVPNPCAITQANSSTMAGHDWSTAQWDFGTATQRPIVLHNGTPVRGQTNRDC